MCNKLSLKTFTSPALPFAFSFFLPAVGVTPTKAAEEAATTTSDTPAVTANHNSGSKNAVHASGRAGGTKTGTHVSATNNHAKPRVAGTHTRDKTHTRQKAAPQKSTAQ